MGPGSSVRMSIDLVTDTARSVAERCGDTLAPGGRWPTSTPTRSHSSTVAGGGARGRASSTPEAMALATASPDGTPSVRMVLLKGCDQRRITFFTNLESRKAAELGGQPARRRRPLLGQPLDRQVRRRGTGRSALPEDESRGVLRRAAARQPSRRMGVAAVPADRRPRRARAPLRRGGGALRRRRGSAAAAPLGRLSASSRRRSSSGRTGRTACTTASATNATATAGARFRLAP